VGVSYDLPHNFRVSGEGQVQHMFQKFNYTTVSDPVIERNQDVSQGFYSSSSIQKDFTLFQHYQFLNLSAKLEKVFPIHKFNVPIGTGLTYRLDFKFDGNVATDDLGLIDLSGNTVYQNRQAVLLFGELGVEYNMNQNWSLFIRTRYNSKSKLHTQNSNFTHDVSSLNIKFGGAVRF